MGDDNKRVTRSQSSSSSTSNPYLSLGGYLFGREARIARSRSPSPQPSTSQQFNFPTTMGDSDSNTAINNLSTALSGLQASSRKPDLPAFDVNNIDKWIKRVESAYIRSGVTLPQEKFAFVESKIGVDVDPTIDEFLFGDATDGQWTAFCSYLRQRYGPTKRQQAAAVLEPIKRDGRIPSNFYSKLKETVGDVTLDDVLKEICIRALPSDIQQTICKATEKMSAQETMKYADSYFSNDGSRLHKTASSVNNVELPQQQQQQQQQPQFTTAYNDEQNNNHDVNAVFGRSRPQQNNGGYNSNNNGGGFKNFRSKSRGRSNSHFNSNSSNNGGPSASANNSSICVYHENFGNRARQCRKPCSWKPQGNGQGHRRM